MPFGLGTGIRRPWGNRMVLWAAGTALLACSGCGWQAMAGKEAVSESVAIRNIVVRDDWVYVKSTGHMHRRYVKGPGWWVFRITQGNPELLAELRLVRGLRRLAEHRFDGSGEIHVHEDAYPR